MPELPEVETTRRGIAPHLANATITGVTIREHRLRWPVAADMAKRLAGCTINSVNRRAKYLLLNTDSGTIIIHLGMSGTLRLVKNGTPPKKHDHVDIEIDSGRILRFNDPRRFGCLLWTGDHPLSHPLLSHLGPEPLSSAFTGHYLHTASTGRRIAIKPHLMNSSIVVGVGNIYASESLFRAGIHPKRAAGRIARKRMMRLTETIKLVLQESIHHGGTTLRDFYNGDGKPGYFSNELAVYNRQGEACIKCRQPIRQITLGQRSTFYCPTCQR
ncbi:MAG: bifunctional DNA-formamidopyrimidine glycosylase/DNA-(apurinic or apyrimidinic site) lyase [Gammaproteobacteria bacterium]|jgi:formamidopyrimidine-DNA glycosylase|nr:DNA-formamidopyrimidine glycosylase [Chromatiales bacterium]MCP4924331.1 bifunctional DNA-formamidopyrimidine glycosylase/DNA-(apurinic or apyrimidinic site) lyase [Gammaproteobacteria bacterium]MDP7419777.1 bifunctional DNA-formamidopyrimidine glycosylase/DNA-(apurinic or apyrimidinic site) lyase [Gammaproteobacteria bacterium]MDP7659655.1 bifunctional DNA-formamidopyrimidine glycosylase/DNA-(apurinic or apyrimidinic site) lyase [Gammaproteobacteria bacterium]HJP38092.1 bifunctional DNA-for